MSDNSENIKKELAKFGADWDKAIVANDVAEIGKFMSEDWVIVGTDGGITAKETFLDFIRSGDLLHDKMEFQDESIKVYDNTAVIIGKGTSSGTYKGEPFSFYEWTSNVYIKKEGKWVCVLTMLTPAKQT